MSDLFDQNIIDLHVKSQGKLPNTGFRPGQLGALYAVLAHISVNVEPATVCLPTGYGKTSLMMALPFLLKTTRLLVVEPSDALRKQVSSHFNTLSTLRRIKAVDDAVPNPNVFRQEGRPTTATEWEALRAFDVVVSTPGSSSPALTPESPNDLFDLIIFDEAHHAPADTWAAYLSHYSKARFIFLTATPFRRDKKLIPGKLVYRYPVTRAVSEGAFVPVSIKLAVVENDIDDQHIDLAIARTAVEQLKADKLAGLDHRLFIRTSSITNARNLVNVYQGLEAKVEAVDSKISKKKQDDCEKRLISGELDGIVCVDMFGEGYDFPKLKIAALHTPHRSLVPTIQFIGRFARVDQATGSAVLVTALTRIREATKELLKEGVSLEALIDAAAMGQLANNAEEQAILEKLPVRKIAESDYEAVSPLSLQLYAHIRIFLCKRPPDFSQFGDTVGRDLRVAKQWASEDGTSTLLLTVDENPPNWATSEVLVNIRHDAFLLVYKPASKICYIGSTRRTEKIYLGMMDLVCTDSYRALSYEETSRARAGLQTIKFYNVGLKNTTFNSQSETYRVLTGPQAERAVTSGDGRAYVQGHFFGSGFDGQEKETIGASSSSRIWSNQRLTISEFFDWIKKMDARLSGTSPFAQTHLDIVRSSKTLTKLPDVIIAATWAKAGFKTNPRVRYKSNKANPWLYSRLTEWELESFSSRPSDDELYFSISSVDGTVPMRFTIGQGRSIDCLNTDVHIEIESATDDWMSLSDWLGDHPPRFYAADKSSFEGVNLMSAPLIQIESLTDDDAKTINWANCEISVEFLPNDQSIKTQRKRAELAGKLTVQEHLEQHLLGLADLEALFFDHRSGEAADYIAVTKNSDGDVEITLYHCKGAGGPVSGGRVSDVYEVAGQLVKSVYYCDIMTLLTHMSERMHSRHKSPSKFLKGKYEVTRDMIISTPATKISFSVVGVQPGIQKNAVGSHLADLMAFGIGYAKQGGAANAYWLVS